MTVKTLRKTFWLIRTSDAEDGHVFLRQNGCFGPLDEGVLLCASEYDAEGAREPGEELVEAELVVWEPGRDA